MLTFQFKLSNCFLFFIVQIICVRKWTQFASIQFAWHQFLMLTGTSQPAQILSTYVLYHSVVMVLFHSLNILSLHLLAKCCFPRALRKACAVLKSIHWNNISQSVYRLSYPQELLSNYNSFFAALFHFLHFAHTSINVFSLLCSLKQVYTNWHVPF